jgi:hypothetical protein
MAPMLVGNGYSVEAEIAAYGDGAYVEMGKVLSLAKVAFAKRLRRWES